MEIFQQSLVFRGPVKFGTTDKMKDQRALKEFTRYSIYFKQLHILFANIIASTFYHVVDYQPCVAFNFTFSKYNMFVLIYEKGVIEILALPKSFPFIRDFQGIRHKNLEESQSFYLTPSRVFLFTLYYFLLLPPPNSRFE